jgi:hypothetical protein
VTEAIHNSQSKEGIENELNGILNNMSVQARADANTPSSSNIPSSSNGKPVSMLPASSKRRKTHGTKQHEKFLN